MLTLSLIMLFCSECVILKDIRVLSDLQHEHVGQSYQQLDSFFNMVSDLQSQISGLNSEAADKKSQNSDSGKATINKTEKSIKNFMDRSDSIVDTHFETDDFVRVDHVGEYSLPIKHPQESLQDIFKRERLPAMQKIIASGDKDEIKKLMAEANKDPFSLLSTNMKYHELLASDMFFNFVTDVVTWFLVISLLLPAVIPMLTIMMLVSEMLALWLMPSIE